MVFNMFHFRHWCHLKTISKLESVVDDLLKFAEIKSLNHDVAEGVVFKHCYKDFSFKVINNRFLLSEKD
jgi:hypothetical protein